MMTKRRWKILVVEDRQDDLDALAEFLRLMEYDVLMAKDGREAIPLLGQSPDLVITNLLMPCVDGFELVEHMKQRCPQIPAIMTSEGWTQERLAKAHELDVSGIFQKPIAPDDFKVIEEILPPCWCDTPDEP